MTEQEEVAEIIAARERAYASGFSDGRNGTPCEAIRMQQEIENLTAERDALARQLRDLNIAWEAKYNRIAGELTAQLERARMPERLTHMIPNMAASTGRITGAILRELLAWLDQQEKP